MAKSATIKKSDDQMHWVVQISENGQVIQTSMVSGTHEEAVLVAERFLAESTQSPVFLKE
jgi:hypothetical protein